MSVVLTCAGTALIDAAAVDLLATEARLLEKLSESDRRALAHLLGTLAAAPDATQ